MASFDLWSIEWSRESETEDVDSFYRSFRRRERIGLK